MMNNIIFIGKFFFGKDNVFRIGIDGLKSPDRNVVDAAFVLSL